LFGSSGLSRIENTTSIAKIDTEAISCANSETII
jgi:hypothetical protein